MRHFVGVLGEQDHHVVAFLVDDTLRLKYLMIPLAWTL
jgi:hypothetical protein